MADKDGGMKVPAASIYLISEQSVVSVPSNKDATITGNRWTLPDPFRDMVDLIEEVVTDDTCEVINGWPMTYEKFTKRETSDD